MAMGWSVVFGQSEQDDGSDKHLLTNFVYACLHLFSPSYWVLSKTRKVQYTTVTVTRVRKHHEMRKTYGFHVRMVSEEGRLT
jgi:hypothetical protein